MPFDTVTEDYFCRQVLLDPNFRAVNLPIAEKEGCIIGFALAITRQVPYFSQGLEADQAWITAFGVHPDCRRQGVGRSLFDYLLTRFTEQGRKRLQISPYVPNYFIPGVDMKAYPEAMTFLENALGFKPTDYALSMGLNLTGFQIPDEIIALEQQRRQKDGLTIHPVTAADLLDVMPFIIEHFGWDWYRHAQEYLLEYFSGSHHHICWLVARCRGEVVGFCQQRLERFGPFGVHPDYRGKGIGRLLLFRCLEIMRARQVYYAYFLWTDENAARLYTKAGFEPLRKFAVLEKVL